MNRFQQKTRFEWRAETKRDSHCRVLLKVENIKDNLTETEKQQILELLERAKTELR